ncbi:PglB [Ruminococcus sp.]|uniref:PglD-related sugar-binding protein n=1 Tax=Ruminococcus sp. TaxID=41978 RepID=UPI0025F51F54|nr:PglB [Ruminococcus sp.]
MSNLLILGAGQYGKVAKEIADSMKEFEQIDFLDDNNTIAVGKLGDLSKLQKRYDSAVVAIGNSEFRLKLIEELKLHGYNIPCLIHERAYVSPSAKIGGGSFIEPMAVVHTDVIIGTGCIISAGVILNHNCKVEEGCHLNCGSIVKARAVIKSRTKTDYNEICDTQYEHDVLVAV